MINLTVLSTKDLCTIRDCYGTLDDFGLTDNTMRDKWSSVMNEIDNRANAQFNRSNIETLSHGKKNP